MARLELVRGRVAAAYFNENDLKIGDSGLGGADLDAQTTNWLAAATTLEALNITDAQYQISSEFADATTRETAKEGFASNVPVLKNCQITFDIRWLPKEIKALAAPWAFTDLLMNAWENDRTIAMVFLDWPIKGNHTNPGSGYSVAPQGLAGNWSVSMEKSEALKDVQRASVTLSVANKASWHTELEIVGT